MSRLARFTEEELKSLTVWQSPGFVSANSPKPEQVPAPPKHTQGLTVEEIESIQQQAHAEAFAQGEIAGHTEGYRKGLAEGIEAGQQQGHAEGLQQGLSDALATHKQQASDFIKLMDALNEPLKTLDETVANQLVSLSIAIAKQLIRREMKQHPGEIIAVVRAAVAALPIATQKLTLHLHPADAELVKTSLALTDSITAWKIVEDPLLTQGGCKVTTDVSLVDATVEKRLASVIAMLWGDERETQDHSAPTLDLSRTESLEAIEHAT